MKHHLETLGLAEGASQEEIQSAFECLSKQLNPAENDNQEFFKEEYEKVQEAYNALNQSSILKNSESSSKTTRSSRPEASLSSQPSGQFTVTISKEKIEELKNRKLDTQQTQAHVPDGLKILSLLSMIGSGLISVIYFVLIFNGFSATLSVIFLIITVPFVLKFIGALRMYKGKKNGFLIYMVPSFIINIIFFISLFSKTQTQPETILFITIVMIIFSVIFNSYKKYLK